MAKSLKTYVYIDGFNLYYGALKGTPYKWLDVKKLLGQTLVPQTRIAAIKYFTAKVSGKLDPNTPKRQAAYLSALKAYIPELEIYYGHFSTHRKRAPLANPTPTKKTVEIIKVEEKGSDVNLAVHLLNDAWLGKYDVAAVVSNDSDLAEAMRIVKDERKKTVGIVYPARSVKNQYAQSAILRRNASFIKTLSKTSLANSQLPDPIPHTNFYKPVAW
ncbi:NYN domain-containing protein [Planctomycetota bacterium]